MHRLTKKHNIMETSTNENKHPIADSLEEFFENLTPEEKEKLWKELEPYNHIGPTVEDYFEYLGKIQK